ncbi:EAL domain-containing protein [Acidovorax delafieldii]|uniref:EAL domain-containing protein n=1 Tax=Acidovorax delafieldii TaxID=47920 RepID=UPI003ECDB95D|eukprot:gene8699-8790_t
MTVTIFAQPFEPVGCQSCRDKTQLPFDFTMAFQPIMDLELDRPFAYEALVRGADGESAGTVLSWVDDTNRYRFDQACRVKAIELASRLGLASLPDCRLSINFLPNAVYRPETCIRATMEAAVEFDFPHNRIMFEVTEGEQVSNGAHLKSIFNEYRRQGLITAIDDFGAGYAGLNMLVQFQPHVLKIDMELIRNIDRDPVRQAIVCGIALVCQRLSIDIVAEGIETSAESAYLSSVGVRYQQGYLFAKPGWESLPLAPRHV